VDSPQPFKKPYSCRFGDGEAIARFSLPGGCIAFPEDREQALCLHHAMRATPLDGMYLVADFSADQAFTRFWNA
jgi:hypothetical protein